jgi:hypothetical protein
LKRLLRALRGWCYRRLPSWSRTSHGKRLAGFERRWNLEADGFTKEGFVRILKKRFLRGALKGHWLELRAGDGLVGSLGGWLESSCREWTVEAWEDRLDPLHQLRIFRPRTRVIDGRMTDWKLRMDDIIPDGITTRGAREASAVCRAVRRQTVRPRWIGIWNPSRRSVWACRLESCGYRLQVVYERMEFFRGETA